MKHTFKIAIYSGDIPSTTFIERLIKGLSNSGTPIYLFGFLKHKVTYHSSVHVIGYKNTKVFKLLHLMKYSFLLFCFKTKEKAKLDRILKLKSDTSLNARVKYYPVLWYKPDIFHVQWAKGIQDWMWVQDFGMKLVLSLRGAHINYSPIADLELSKIYRDLFPQVDAFHAVSKAIALEAQKYGVPIEKTKVVYSGLDFNKNAPFYPKKTTVFQIISVGRSHWIKGYNYAIDACKILKENAIQFHYTIIGSASDIELLYQVHDLGLENHITLLSEKSFEEAQIMLSSADLLLLPSLKEGIANVVLEAMALGTPVLSTDCGGMNEVIQDGVNGFICPIRNPKAMADRIVDISQLPEHTVKTITEQAKATISKDHTLTTMVDGMEQLYLEVCSD